jgi:hypothetical protein
LQTTAPQASGTATRLVRIVAGVLALLMVVRIILRRKKNENDEDEDGR